MRKIKLSDFIDWMSEVYKSIDLRVATGKIDDKWVNALTVIRFSSQGRDDIDAQFKEIENRLGEIRADNFQILQHTYSFGELDSLVSEFKQEKLILEGREIHFGNSIDLPSFEDRFPSYHDTIINKEGYPTLDLSLGRHSSVLDVEVIAKEIRKFGFNDIYEAVKELLELTRFAQPSGFDVVVSAPFYARIKEFDFEGQTSKTKVEFHENVSGLVLNVLLREKERDGRIKLRRSIEMAEGKIWDKGGEFKVWESEVELPTATRNDYLTVKLAAHKESLEELDEIDSSANSVDYFRKIKEPVWMPFISCFSRFCSVEDFREQLTKPHGRKIPGVGGADKVFERSIQWLLNLVGYPAIKLDEYEKLKARKTKVDLGSVDVVAYNGSRRSLFLINCTIHIPASKEMESYNNVRGCLYNELFKDSDIQIIPIVFSAQRDLKLTKGEGQKIGVKIFDIDDMEKILGHLKRGEFESIRQMLED